MATVSITRTTEADAAQLLYERYYPNVYRYALSQLRSPQDAEDAAQNTFLRAFGALQKGAVPENEVAWLFKIAHNVCATSKLAWLRRRRVETPRDLDALPLEPSSPETRRDELAGLQDALAAMPPRLREAFLLREWQGLSYAEIAERLDTSHSAVETLIFRARKMLARQLEQPLQRLRQALGLGPLLSLVRGLIGGSPAAVKAAGVIVIAAGTTAAATPLARPAPAVPANVPTAPAGASWIEMSRPAVTPLPTAQAGVSRPGVRQRATTPAAASPAPVSSPPVSSEPASLQPVSQPGAPATATPADGPTTEAPSAQTPSNRASSTPATPVVSAATPSLPVATPSLPVTTPSLPVTPPLLPVATPSLPVTTPSLPVPPAVVLEPPALPTVTVPAAVPVPVPALPGSP
jgi:RNA polymerase sigma factor (sigma-70 family)